MEKVYIAGAGGMLGDAFYRQFKKTYNLKCSDIDVNESWLSFLDFRDYDSYRRDVVDFQPDYLIHLGAHTDLEYCETNQADAYLTNTMAVENAALIANLLNIPLIYVSTAGIFDGTKESYDDWDTPNPLGHYARSKYMGELTVTQRVKDHLVCRAGWMMGGGPNKDKKFIQKIMSQIKTGSKELFVVDDKFGTPTYTHDFANNVQILIEQKRWGLFNMVCQGQTSRLDVARQIIDILKLQDIITITAVDSSHFGKTYFAPRPNSEMLINRKLNLLGLDKMRDWRESLQDYIKVEYTNYL